MEKRTAWKLVSFLFGFSVAAAFLAGCGNDGVRVRFAQTEPPEVSPENRASPTPRPTGLPAVTAKLRNTHYYTIFETDYAGAPDTSVRDVNGRILATVTAAFYRDLRMEGAGKLRDGRVLNYVEKIGGISRYQVSPNPWGNGVGSCALVPFRTIAVDRKVIPLGATVYIDQTKGMPLPDGTVHDGVWRADDVGGAILKDRVDLYIGKRGWNGTLSKFRIGHLQALDVRILKQPDGESCAYRRR